MVGLIFSLFYFGWSYFVSNDALIPTYQSATNFLFWWYVVFAVIMGLFYLVISILGSLVLGLKGAESFGSFGGVLGLVGGGTALTTLLAVNYAINYGSLLFGAHLLRTAWTGETWDTVRVAFGVLLLLVGIIVGRSRSASSSKED